MKPDWKDAPDFATKLAKDGNGQWHWYEKEPYWDELTSEWLTDGRYLVADEPAITGNGTLESRP